MIEREVARADRNKYYEELGREELSGAAYVNIPAKRFIYEGMLIDAKHQRALRYMDTLFATSKITLKEFNTLFANVCRADFDYESASGWKEMVAKYATK